MSPLSLQGGFLVVVAAGLLCHLVFKRHEPTSPLSHLGLLVVVPAILSTLFLPNSSTFTRAFGFVYLLYYSTVLLSVIVYRLSPWHPLARYPGPIPCRISKFWMAWVSRDGKQHIYYSKLHQAYGDVVRIGPNELSIRDVNAVVPLMGSNGFPKGPHWDGRMAEQTATRTVISVRDPVEHARRRKPWHRAFSVAALKGYDEILGKRVQQFLTVLEQQTQPFNLAELISHFTFDFMSDMAFGGGSEMLRDGDKDNTWHLLENGLPTALVLSHVPWLGKYYANLPGIGEGLKKFRTFCQARAMLRRSAGSLSKDLFHYLIDEAGLERHTSPPTFAEVASDGVLAIVAGSDTTATTLSSLFLSILRNPQTYYRLQAEVDKFFPPGEDLLSTVHYPHMSYLILSGSQRGVPRGGDDKFVGPYFLPEGTNAFVHTYSLHRDPRNFSPAPDTFWPERWLKPEERAALSSFDAKGLDKFPIIHDTKAFVPFSFGPMHCVGKQLAYQELRMAVCAMMHRLNFSFAPGYNPESWEHDLKDYFVAMKGSLQVVLSPRNLSA
ncbi:cytochrome P450 [Suillus discolor]|uniref:Cytochrome P450 n=1 Tax=Suillus discolor TaxID=1912936 RepID=A0A9P7F8U8_9AGAM|nr:cytochrome P450 [Suillus discolor]KAG2110892.1 cytochrome P450 [Suillus discolor]